MKSISIIFTALLFAASGSYALDNREQAAHDSAACLDCHDFGPEAKVHALLAGSHGLAGDNEAMDGRHGCPDCHGPSTDHVAKPKQVSPDVSFGPKWTSSPGVQDSRCLACHEENTARNWKHALHMINNLTCVTCHDLLTWEDKVMFEEQQADVCTMCHKAQKQGIHGMQEMADSNPPCSACHNPHDHESAENEMLHNDSVGCRSCHDPRVLQNFYEPAQEGNDSFHQMTPQADHTCLDCHQGIAHAAVDSVTAMVPQALSRKEITLFYPGTADSDWLRESHPGSQDMRQGRNCQQCHRGEEAVMGEAQSAGRGDAFRNVQVAFTLEADQLLISLQWQGPKDDSSISLMWSGRDAEALRNSGCFAACHSDMTGMGQDRGQQPGKYLSASRVQTQQEMLAQGEFAELWRIQLQSSTVEESLVLADTRWEPATSISVEKHYRDGQWDVTISRKLNEAVSRLGFTEEDKYTFGVALNGANNRG